MEQAKEHLSTKRLKKKQLLVGDYKTVTSLVNYFVDLDNIFCMTVSKDNNVVKHNSATLKTLLTHTTTEDLTIALMKKVR